MNIFQSGQYLHFSERLVPDYKVDTVAEGFVTKTRKKIKIYHYDCTRFVKATK